MKHKGKILEKAVRNSNISITKIAKLAGYTGRHMYNLFEYDKLENDVLINIGKIIGHDFSEDLPELTEYLMVKEPEAVYEKNINYQKKYYALLEEHVLLLKELSKKTAAGAASTTNSRPKKEPKNAKNK